MTTRFTPEHWRARADEARAAAEQYRDPECRKTLLNIAEGYERLALTAEQLVKTDTVLANEHQVQKPGAS